MKVSAIFVSCLTLTLFTVSGCSSENDMRASARIVGVETISGQALQEVRSTKTQFAIPASDSREAWERARVFFIQYLAVKNLSEVEQVLSPNQVVMTNEHRRGQKYLYQVLRETDRVKGIQYLVLCSANGAGSTKQTADLNAKNLARFIQTGTLEVSLLGE